MHSTGKLFATTMIAAAGAVSAALALSGTAAAQPAAPAPTPGVPGLPFIQQLASNPAAATQLMQGFTSLLNTASTPATPATPATPPQTATASITLPQTPPATACCRRSAQHRGCACDQPGRPADAGRVAAEQSRVVDARRNAVDRPSALGFDGRRTRRCCRRTCARRTCGGSSAAAAAPAALPRGTADSAAVGTALTAAATSTEKTTTTTHWGSHVNQDDVRHRRRCDRLIGHAAVRRRDRCCQRRPGATRATADRRAAGPGPAGGAEPRTRHSAGRC